MQFVLHGILEIWNGVLETTPNRQPGKAALHLLHCRAD